MWILSVILTVLKSLAGFFTVKEPIKEVVTRPAPEIEIDDGKTDEERLDDFGL